MELHKYNNKYNQLVSYISGHKEDKEVSNELLDMCKEVVDKLIHTVRNKGMFLSIPNACPGLNNNFMYVWDDGNNYLECEVFLSKDIEFFYKNRTNNCVWGLDIVLNQDIPNELINKLLLFSI